MLDRSVFEYDQHVPVVLTVLSERVRDEAILQDVSYASPLGGLVSAYLIGSPVSPPRAGLIFGHWGEGDREEFVDEAIILARLGFVSLCLDAPFRRPVEYEPPTEPAQMDLQWILDVRRAVDLLLDRYALEPKRLGYVGHSFGASLGGVIAAIEHRIKAFVLMAGGYSATEIMRTSCHPGIVQARQTMTAEAFEAMLTSEAPYDACHYIGQAAPSHLFFQFARLDDFVSVRDGERYFDLGSSPKEITWYDDCHHELSQQARLDRVTWLCEELGLAQPQPEIRALLTQVPSPIPIEKWNDE
jgi:pimeloyl-ACP methyl ester carboxylesterase